MLRIGVISLGAPLHASNFAKNVDGKSPNYWFTFYPYTREYGYGQVDWSQVDVLWNFGFFFNADQIIESIKEENPKLKVVNTWAGSDMLESRQMLAVRPKCKDCLFKAIDIHVTDWVGFQKELKEWFNLESMYVPSIPQKPMSLKPLPKKFTVAVYMPRERTQFFQYGTIRNVALNLPKIPFYLFPSHRLEETDPLFKGIPRADSFDTGPPANMHFMDFVEGEEKEKWWTDCSALIVIPVHGSVSVTGIEFMQMGRSVITNREIPYMEECNTVDAIKLCLSVLKHRKKPNSAASKYYLEEYSPKRQFEYTEKVLKKL